MENLKLTPSESSFLFALVSQCLFFIKINPDTGKQELPNFIDIDLREFDPVILRSLYRKLD